jgi:hypothetical protein
MMNDPKSDGQPTIEDLEPRGDVKGGSTNEKKKKTTTTTSDQQDYLKIELKDILISG